MLKYYVQIGNFLASFGLFTDFKSNGEEVAPMELVDVYQVIFVI